MSSFFTTPASQRKRKRTDAPSTASKKRNVAPSTSQSTKAPRRKEREESISGSGSSDEEQRDVAPEEEASGSSDDEGETAAEKRLRLAERYLESIRVEVEDDGGFDAADIDRDLISERLKEDVAETKGKIYRKLAQGLDFINASHVFGKSGIQKCITGCAVRLPYVWTISKDMVIEKWEIADPKSYNTRDPNQPSNITPRRTPKKLFWRKGNKNRVKDRDYLGHTSPILSIAISDSGKFLATGDSTARLIIWDADTLTPRKMFTQHRGAITSLAFRRGTEQLYSASADRSVKIWSASELAYIDTLLGHQDSLVDIVGGLDGTQETCLSVGGRDRTAILWKVVEETMLKFNGGGTARQKGLDKLRKGQFGEKSQKSSNVSHTDSDEAEKHLPVAYAEGSMDCISVLDASLFVTGSDNGGLSLWSITRKKPVFTLPLTHGCDPPLPPEEMSANINAAETGVKPGPRLARYVTAIAAVPFSDLILTASWDGWIRVWRVGDQKRSIEEVGAVGWVPLYNDDDHLVNGDDAGIESARDSRMMRGIVNGLSVVERGDRGKDGLCIIAAVGKEPRLGSWMRGRGRNGIYVFEVPRKSIGLDMVNKDDAEQDL